MRSLLKTALIAALATGTWADEVAEKGRAVLESRRDAVVTVKLVVKESMSFQGMPSQESDSVSEVTGTLIGADGLSVLSLFETDPSGLIENMMAGMGQTQGLDMSTEIQEAHYLMKDGSEIPVEVVLRDKDLDMVFFRPVDPQENEFPFIDLSEEVKPDVLDQLVSISRLGKVAGREHAVEIRRVGAVIEKPRTFYMPENAQNATSLGSPVFTLDNELVGIYFLRMIRTSGGGGGFAAMMGGMQDAFTAVILPPGDVLESASQVPPVE